MGCDDDCCSTRTQYHVPASFISTSTVNRKSATDDARGYPTENTGADVSTAVVTSSLVPASCTLLTGSFESAASTHTSYSVVGSSPVNSTWARVLAAATVACPEEVAPVPAPFSPATTCATEGVVAPFGTATAYKVPASFSCASTVMARSPTVVVVGYPDTNVGGVTSTPVNTSIFVAAACRFGVESCATTQTSNALEGVIKVPPTNEDTVTEAAMLPEPEARAAAPAALFPAFTWAADGWASSLATTT